jgi:hypothetical protein
MLESIMQALFSFNTATTSTTTTTSPKEKVVARGNSQDSTPDQETSFTRGADVEGWVFLAPEVSTRRTYADVVTGRQIKSEVTLA